MVCEVKDWITKTSHRTKKRQNKKKLRFCDSFQSIETNANHVNTTTPIDAKPLDRSAKQRGKVAHTARPGKPKGENIHSLIEMRDESTRTVQEAEDWEEVEMIVDSGASGTVIGADMIRAVEANNVNNDVSYKLADGSRVPHMGGESLQSVY